MNNAMLAPAAALVIWSLIVMCWMAVTRFGGLKTMPRDKLRELLRAGARGQDVERVMPGRVNWAAHNYAHLMEQPTLFYATVTILALLGEGGGLNLAFAWSYVALRILHSLWQGTVNTVPVRFGLFVVSSLCLGVLAVNALRAALA